jgi:hypothetical protein
LNYQRTVDFSYLNIKEPSITVLWEKEKEKHRIKEPPMRVISKIVTNLQFSPKNQYRTGSFLTGYLFPAR